MRILIPGGTGTLGKELLKQLVDDEVYVISRDELKQQQLKKQYRKVKFIIGDIRNAESMRHIVCRIQPQIIFHAAALKHVDVVEENVNEGMLTNYQGVVNVHRAALEAGTKVMALSSTDKAVLPINAYGYTKGLAEKYLFQTSCDHSLTNIVFRYGNVLGSRGSVIHAFAKSLKEENKVYLTHHLMSRFWIPIEKAVAFMIERTRNVYNGQLEPTDINRPLIPEIKALPVIEIARLVGECLDIKDWTIQEVGIRPGEKIHECLYSSHDHCITSEKAEQCDVEEIKEYIKKVLDNA
jgi:FlaA1/EpsC-like NDP-sugar epimerase